jgi:hypothetical protein
MFLENKYSRWYYRIIDAARTRSVIGYTERHHVLPRCLGGTDCSQNLVALTAREHFIAHRLLVKMVEGRNRSKMSFAYACMFRGDVRHRGRKELRLRSGDYALRKRLLAEAASDVHKGRLVSPEAIDKMRASRFRNAKPYPEESRTVQSLHTKRRWKQDYQNMYETCWTPETRQKISLANKGQDRLSKAQRTALSDGNRGAKNARARLILVTDPSGTEHLCHGSFQTFCKEHSLAFSSMCLVLKGRVFRNGSASGWKARYLD